MTDTFDPYRKWLGIPPDDQPPHHYRLLGIEPFESDTDVIVNAADGRMAQVKNFQIGKYSELSQRILNELAAAKICLLNPEKKQQYDRELRPRLEAERKGLPKAAPPAVRRPRPTPDATAETVLPAIETSTVFSYVSSPSRRRRTWLVLMAILIGAGAMVAASLAVLDWGNGPEVAQAPASSERRPAERPAEGPPKPSSANRDQPPGPPVAPQTEVPPPPVNPPIEREVAPSEPDPGLTLADLLDPPDPQQQGDQAAGPGLSSGPAPGLTPEGAAAPAKRSPPPEDRARREAELRTREIFKRELAEAATPRQKLALAEKLANQAEKTADDPAARFVLLRLACEKAAEASGLTAALGLADRLRQLYDLDVLTLKADLLDKAAGAMSTAAPGSAASQQLADEATKLADEAVAADSFDLAGRFLRVAISAARKTKDQALLRRLEGRDREIARMKLRFVEVGKALDLLANNPGDREASLLVGRWYCFDAGNWDKGLPLLAKGADGGLAKLAEQDLARPDEPKRQMLLADQWWSLAKVEKGPQQRGMQMRAQYWYELALPGLTGLDKAEVEKRLAELTSAVGPSRAKIRGVVRKGNVALASNGATAVGGKNNPASMLDGEAVDLNTYAFGAWPCEWTITFDKVYELQEIRFKLWDGDKRYYRYAVQTSPDERTYTSLVDRSQGEWSSWQQIAFPSRPVKAVKLIGLYDSANPYVHVVEFEAYCIPPPLPPK
jgi:hypothetical protein